MRIISEKDAEEYFSDGNERKANVELVRNPFIAFYLFDKQNEGKKDVSDFQFEVDPADIIPINQDILYNDKVSSANFAYKYTDTIREESNIRYVRSNSSVISNDYRKNLIDNGADNSEDFLIPLDYVLVTRKDKSQFMIVEDFSNPNLPNDMHKYTIIRYAGKRNPFKVDSIYSNGIDLARVLTNDNHYIDIFANIFLSELRLNESLLSTYGALDIQDSDETDHGAGYVGYIDTNTLRVGSTMEKEELLSFERAVNGRSIAI